MLAETGYDGMTVDAVAARAGMARATVYQRWASKTDLVLAAAARLSADDADLDRLSDTGTYRDDAIAMFVPDTAEDQQIRLQVLTALLLMARADPRVAEAATLAGIEPWIELNRVLMQRAVDRGEFPPGDIDTLAQVIPLLCLSRALQQKPITAEFSPQPSRQRDHPRIAGRVTDTTDTEGDAR